eukprot:scaffold375638_cov58-Attheya_sp.AAC.2
MVLWGAAISQGQQWTNTHGVRPVFCSLSPSDQGLIWGAWELIHYRRPAICYWEGGAGRGGPRTQYYMLHSNP